MSRYAYVNGQYVPHRAAAIHIEDRGYQFADGVYEVMAVHRGAIIDEGAHLARLARSLAELRIRPPLAERALRHVLRRVVRMNRVAQGSVYLQVTRGVAPRDHAFPARVAPQLVITAKRAKPVDPTLPERGAEIITIPDIRWQRCDIKSIALLPNILGKQAAREAGAYEAWQVDRAGCVTEGTSSNAWIVTRNGVLITRPAGPEILSGITRQIILGLAGELGLAMEERPFTVAEALEAREAFLTSTTAFVMPVTRIDGNAVANGAPGLFAAALRERYLAHLDSAARRAAAP